MPLDLLLLLIYLPPSYMYHPSGRNPSAGRRVESDRRIRTT